MAYGNTSYGGGSGAATATGSSTVVVVPCPNIAVASGITVRVDTIIVRPCPNITVVFPTPTITGILELNAIFKGDQNAIGNLKNRPPAIATPESIWPNYRLVVVDYMGNRYGSLDNAVISQVSWELNADGGFTFTLPSDDPKAALVQAASREVQLWYGPQLLHWGVCVRVKATDTTTEFQCVGLGWYLTKRVVGQLPIPNQLKNGSFDAPTTNAHWQTDHGDKWTHGDVGWSTSKDAWVGDKCIRLTADRDNHNSWFQQRQTVSTHAERGGDTYTVSCWVYIESFHGPAYKKRGLFLRAINATTGKVYKHATALITAKTPRQKWVRLQTSIKVPRKSVDIIVETRLYPPHGAARFDEVRLTYNQRLEYYQKDQAVIVKGLLNHSQDTSVGKTSLNFGVSCPSTKVLRNREYFFYDHQIIRELIDEFPTLANGMDWDITWTPTTRTFRTYYPMKGIDHGKKQDFVFALGSNIDTYTVDIDGQDIANFISVVSINISDDGSAREEATAKAGNYLGGIDLEKVYDATPMSTPASLPWQAKRGLARYKKPVVIPTITTFQNSHWMLGFINVGDFVPVRLKDGWVSATGSYRILKIDLDPTNNALTFTLNPADMSF